MERLVKKYADKIITANLGENKGASQPLVGGLDDKLVWNRKADESKVLEKVFKGLNLNSLIFLRPKEPYGSLINFLGLDALNSKGISGFRKNQYASYVSGQISTSRQFSNGIIQPKDCETKTFLHDLPVINEFNADKIIKVLKKRKSVIIVSKERHSNFHKSAIIAHGSVSPEQCFVTISSVCFACFVKFFADYLYDHQTGNTTSKSRDFFKSIIPLIKLISNNSPQFNNVTFKNEKDVYSGIIEAGKKTIEYELVDSYFGNASFYWNNTLYISQTGSSLDELEGCIDPVPSDNSTSAGITASSELSAHLKIIEKTGYKAILHGHPKFCVIASMDCDPGIKANCKFNGQCHIKCPEKRFIGTTPIVPGEVGTGPFGLCHTLPKAFEQTNNAIVYGHGLFTTGENNFAQAFNTMLQVENYCRNYYFEKVKSI